MTVRELIDRLEEMDEDAEVILMTQQSWPFENGIKGVPVRKEVADADEDGPDERSANDGFIVEGSKIR